MNFEYEERSPDKLTRFRWHFTFHLMYGRAYVQLHRWCEETRESTRKQKWETRRYWIAEHLRNEFGMAKREKVRPIVPDSIDMKLRDAVERKIQYDYDVES